MPDLDSKVSCLGNTVFLEFLKAQLVCVGEGGGKQMPNCSGLALRHWGCCGTWASTTSFHDIWTVLVQVTDPVPGGFACTKVVHRHFAGQQ